jgi:hypothetical protein
MKEEPPTLGNITKEFARKGYFERANQRAQRRKSPWNLLLIPVGIASIAVCAYALFMVMWGIHVLAFPEHAGQLHAFWPDGISGHSFVSSFLLAAPSVFQAIPLGLMLTNCIVWCVPPARAVFKREAQGVKWASFGDAMRGLAKLALVFAPVWLALSVAGALTLSSLR